MAGPGVEEHTGAEVGPAPAKPGVPQLVAAEVYTSRGDVASERGTCDFASLSAIFFCFFENLASTPELGPQNLSLGRKFCAESDFQLKNSQFQCPEAKN